MPWVVSGLVAVVLFAGCAAPKFQAASPATGCRSENVFLFSPGLAPDLKRLAVLPLACEDQRTELADGCEALGPIVQAELIKTRKFEVVSVSPEILRNRTGRSAWTGAEALPPQFFESLREVYACDAVLFCQLTVFRAYAPVAVGWRVKLVNARTGQILWAADELFDTGQRAVLREAMNYRWQELLIPTGQRGEWLMQNSPRRFGQYAAAQVFETLPGR